MVENKEEYKFPVEVDVPDGVWAPVWKHFRAEKLKEPVVLDKKVLRFAEFVWCVECIKIGKHSRIPCTVGPSICLPPFLTSLFVAEKHIGYDRAYATGTRRQMETGSNTGCLRQRPTQVSQLPQTSPDFQLFADTRSRLTLRRRFGSSRIYDLCRLSRTEGCVVSLTAFSKWPASPTRTRRRVRTPSPCELKR